MHQVNYCSHAQARVLYASELFPYEVTLVFDAFKFLGIVIKRRTKKFKKEYRENQIW